MIKVLKQNLIYINYRYTYALYRNTLNCLIVWD